MKQRFFMMMLLLCSTSFLLADLPPRDSFLITQPDNANGLPFGVYIILLKENGTIVAETKVLIR